MRRAILPVLALSSLSFSHEPIFGLGPGTIFKGGVGIETEYERLDRDEGVATEVLYGITEDLSVTLRGLQTARELSETAIRLKYRVWKRYMPGRIDALSLIGGVRRDLEGKVTYAIAGVAAGMESRRWYLFADVRTAGKLFVDGAVGIRPWLTEYLKPDLVLLTELNYEQKGDFRAFFMSPAFFFTYRNVAVKGGVQIPAYRSDRASHVRERVSFSVEIHF